MTTAIYAVEEIILQPCKAAVSQGVQAVMGSCPRHGDAGAMAASSLSVVANANRFRGFNSAAIPDNVRVPRPHGGGRARPRKGERHV